MSTRIEKIQAGIANRDAICQRCRPHSSENDMYKPPMTKEKLDKLHALQKRNAAQ